MRRRIVGAFLVALLVVPVGLGRLLWASLRLVGGWRPKTLLTLGALALALSLPSPLTAALRSEVIGPAGHAITSSGAAVLGLVSLGLGARSRWLRRLGRRAFR